MAIYLLDTEFDGFGGPLISFALVRDDGKSLSLNFGVTDPTPWVAENVVPFMWSDPHSKPATRSEAQQAIVEFFRGDKRPEVVSDWPDDIRHFCELLITGPGQMINIPRIAFEVIRVNAYPTTLEGAVQHNPWWDAMALRLVLLGKGL